jgi:hypothetical protein
LVVVLLLQKSASSEADGEAVRARQREDQKHGVSDGRINRLKGLGCEVAQIPR